MQWPVGGPTAARVALATLLLAASAACSSGSDANRARAGNSVPSEPATTTTTNPYAVPAVIDAAYVNRVLAGLDAVLGDVTRLLMRTRTFPQEAYDRLKAIYGDNRWLQLKLDAFQTDLQRGFSDYKPTPGNKVTNVTKLVDRSPRCIFAEVHRNYSAVTDSTIGANPQWVALKPLDPSRDPSRYNPTSWAFVYDGAQPDRSQPSNPCAT